MKKVLFFFVIAGLTAFAACNSGQKKIDEAKVADSLAKVKQAHIDDSIKAAQNAVIEKAKADSIAKAAPAK